LEKMNPTPLYLVLTFDAEADVFDGSIATSDSCAPTWRGIEQGIPLITTTLAAMADSTGESLRATWFVRTDWEIRDVQGDAAFLLQKYALLWRERLAAGDEIGFHPHVARAGMLDEAGQAHRREIRDVVGRVRAAGFAPTVSRVGEAFGSNAVMSALEGEGFVADSTAMPGRVRRDAQRTLDWGGTPANPYKPSVADYRRPGQVARDLLEIPFSMVPVLASYDAVPLARYVDLSFHHQALREGLRSLIATASLLVTVVHPSTLLPQVAFRHGLLSFDVKEFERNLGFIFAEAARYGRPVRCITLGECARMIAAQAREAAVLV
jgi:hypothetical protein